MEQVIHICRPTLGGYGEPRPARELAFVNDEGERTKAPRELRCEGSEHVGRKYKFPVSEMYFRSWQLTDEELSLAIDRFDMFSLEVPPQIICKNCVNVLASKVLTNKER